VFRGDGIFICVKNYIDCRVLCTGEVFEMITVDVKGRNPKFAWEVVGVYTAPNEDMRVMERLATWTGFTGNSTKHSIIGGYLNLPYTDWNGSAGGNSGTEALINNLVWENGYSQLIDSPTRGYALLDVYLVRTESPVTSSGKVQAVSDHLAVILEVEWEHTCTEPQVERVVPVYNETDVSGSQTFLRNKFVIWATNGSSVQQIWNNFKNIVHESIGRLVPHKTLRKYSDPEY